MAKGKWQVSEKHLWHKNKDGTPDIFAYSSSFCNGVMCMKCGRRLCVHCHPDWENRNDKCYGKHYICSCCGYENLEETAYCPHCGAKMDGDGKDAK